MMAFTGLGRTAAYRLMQQPAAPARLNTGGAHRWNGAQVLAFLHQPPDDTRASEPTPQAPGDQATDHSADGRALRSLTVDMVARSTGTTPDGIATFVVEPSAVAGAARRARVAALLAPASGHTHRSDEKASA
ncbi:MAG TPA: hypothetical protein VHO26_06905 [Propionibacteriaceae bacterium]|nr:hypothetical protein [Propionibacteriaceae bacterium]